MTSKQGCRYSLIVHSSHTLTDLLSFYQETTLCNSFCRQIVYSETCNKDAPANTGDKSKAKTEQVPLLKPRNPFQSFAPFIGGLHIQLNAVEDVVQNYHSIMKFLYENLFLNAILALKARPW